MTTADDGALDQAGDSGHLAEVDGHDHDVILPRMMPIRMMVLP